MRSVQSVIVMHCRACAGPRPAPSRLYRYRRYGVLMTASGWGDPAVLMSFGLGFLSALPLLRLAILMVASDQGSLGTRWSTGRPGDSWN